MNDSPKPTRYGNPPKAISLKEYVNWLDQHGGEDSMPYVIPVLVLIDLKNVKRFNLAVELYVRLGWFRPDAPFRKIRDAALRAPEITTADPSSFQRNKDHDPVAEFSRGLAPYRTERYAEHVNRVKRQRRGGMPMND